MFASKDVMAFKRMRNFPSYLLYKEQNMSIRNKLTGAVLSLALIATFSIASYAQQKTATGTSSLQSENRGMRQGGRRHGMPVMLFMHKLNLTDAQKDQARVIVQRFKASIEPQRQALRELHKQRELGTVSDDVREKAKTLRGEIRTSMKGAHSELLTILTPEQRSQYDQMELQMKARRAERRARRGERKSAQPENVPAQ
jgi:Spy/CpxP family protein refolding chaperone